MDTKQIFINDINLSSEDHDKYFISCERDLEELRVSINTVGLINPVVLTKKHETFTIVCGRQRIMAFQKLGKNIIDARVLDGISDEGLLLLSLHDNLFARGFNEIEKAIIIKKFLEIGYSYERLTSQITPLIDMPPNKKIIDKYLSLLLLEKEFRVLVARGKMELEKAILLAQLDNAERDYVYKILFKESSPNVNETKEAIRNLLDLMMIKQTDAKGVLVSDEIKSVLSDNKTNKRQKGEKVCKILKTMRYPTISKKEEEFSKSCNGLGLDNHVRITHSKYFEGNDIQITIKTSNEEKLKENIEKLMTGINDGKFKKVFSVIKETSL